MDKRKIFTSLNIEKRSPGKYSSDFDTLSVIIIGVSSLILFLCFILGYDLQKALLHTESIYIVYAVDAFIFLLVEQKIFRVFVFHEKEMMSIFLQQKLSSNTTLAPYYNIRIDGFEVVKHRELGVVTKCLYRNGIETIYISVHQGSKYSLGTNSRDHNIKAISTARNYLRMKGYTVIKNTYLEPNNNKVYKYYDKCILKADKSLSRDFSVVMDHLKSKKVNIYMTTYVVIAKSAEQKRKLLDDAYEFIKRLQATTYRSVEVLDKDQIHQFYKIENGLDVLDASSLLMDSNSVIPLGKTKVLAVYDNDMNMLKKYNEPTKPTLVGDYVDSFKRIKFKRPKRVKKLNQGLTVPIEDDTKVKITLG